MENLVSKKITIGYDLHLDLQLYKIPKSFISNIKSKFKNIDFIKIYDENTKNLNKIDIYFGNRITKEIITSAANLKWIHFGSVGVEKANLPIVIKKKIIVTNSKGTMDAALSISALGFIIYFARKFDQVEKLRAAKNLTRKTFDKSFDQVSDLKDQKCLIVGKGSAGSKLEAACKILGMQVLSIKKNLNKNSQKNNEFKLSKLNNLVKVSDYVVNLLPLTNLTKEIYNKKLFKLMKKTSYFINLGRGESVVENDLIEALKKNVIAGAALDVFTNEPLLKKSKLWQVRNLFITPHVGGLHNKYWDHETLLFQKNLNNFINKKSMINQIKLNKKY